jgi:hypothetical protein
LHALSIRREDFKGAFDDERVATPKEHFHVALLFVDNRYDLVALNATGFL